MLQLYIICCLFGIREFNNRCINCVIPVSPFRYPGSDIIYEIPSREMIEFRMFSDPQFNTSVFFTQAGAEELVGKEVRVINGPFKGSIGRLIRKKKHCYF